MSVSFYVGSTEVLNMANGNFASLFNAMNEPHEYCGQWKTDDLPRVRAVLLKIANSEKSAGKGVRLPSDIGGPGTGMPRMIDFGVNADYIKEKARVLLEACDSAQQAGVAVSWS